MKLRRDRVVVVLEYKIYVYNFADLKLLDHIETTQNSKGLCALCPYSSNTVLVCPGLQKGHVRVELYDLKKTTLIEAHETALACVALNFDGTRLATASETVSYHAFSPSYLMSSFSPCAHSLSACVLLLWIILYLCMCRAHSYAFSTQLQVRYYKSYVVVWIVLKSIPLLSIPPLNG